MTVHILCLSKLLVVMYNLQFVCFYQVYPHMYDIYRNGVVELEFNVRGRLRPIQGIQGHLFSIKGGVCTMMMMTRTCEYGIVIYIVMC